MERKYKDVAKMDYESLQKALLDIRMERYMNDPDLARELILEVLERETNLERHELIDDLYNEGYWA